MKFRQKRWLWIVLGMLLLAQLACERGDLFIRRIQCEAKGGTWTQEDEGGETYFNCSMPATPAPMPANPEFYECLATTGTNWSYEDFRSSSGTGGVTCNAQFVFNNPMGVPVSLVIHTSWDNNAMNFAGWENHPVAAGGSWEKQVSRTLYNDGVVTYERVDYLFVILDIPACTKYLDEQSMAGLWDRYAKSINGIPCP